MKKDSYYFPHFYNARSDRKMLRVRRELGIEGYAIYFMLLEVLREQTNFAYPLEDIDLLADEFKTSEQKIKTVITNYKLFQVNEEEFFYSEKLIQNLQPYIESSERARLAARKRWDKAKELNANADANALLEQSKCNASQNAKRGKERKGEDIYFNEEKIDEIYKLYPKKVGKKTGYDKLSKIKYSDELFDKIKKHIIVYKKEDREVNFYKDFSAYVNQQLWEDLCEDIDIDGNIELTQEQKIQKLKDMEKK